MCVLPCVCACVCMHLCTCYPAPSLLSDPQPRPGAFVLNWKVTKSRPSYGLCAGQQGRQDGLLLNRLRGARAGGGWGGPRWSRRLLRNEWQMSNAAPREIVPTPNHVPREVGSGAREHVTGENKAPLCARAAVVTPHGSMDLLSGRLAGPGDKGSPAWHSSVRGLPSHGEQGTLAVAKAACSLGSLWAS